MSHGMLVPTLHGRASLHPLPQWLECGCIVIELNPNRNAREQLWLQRLIIQLS
jgi:hypothetical protein